MSPIRDMGQHSCMLSLLPAGSKKTGFSRLIKEVVHGALKALQEGNLKAFDANAGDSGCQNQALLLRHLLLNIKTEECSTLVASKSPESVRISKELEYVLLCYMLAFTKVAAVKLPCGVVTTKSDPERLRRLSKRLTLPAHLIGMSQTRLSHLSMEGLRKEAKKLGDPLVSTMLSDEHTHIIHSRYTPKAFGCLFFELKLILSSLREEKALVGLKTIGNSKFDETLLLQPKKRGGRFELTELPLSSECVVIFEAVVTLDRDRAATLLAERSFTQIVLACAAKDAPYEPGSTPKDVQLPEARTEMLEHAKKAVEGVKLFHVYLTKIGGDDES